jgi:mono/diheme cytochrome c family protein
MKIWIFLAALVLAAAVAAAQTPSPATAQAPVGDADTGKTLYVSIGCYQCHGFEGQGGAAGPKIAPQPFPLAAMTAYVRRPANQMPGYSERIVTDAQLAHIHAYLESLPEPPPVESIPLLQN